MRVEIPEGRASEVIDGVPVFWWIPAHSVDTDWPIWTVPPPAPEPVQQDLFDGV